jgi:hypothetical protein
VNNRITDFDEMSELFLEAEFGFRWPPFDKYLDVIEDFLTTERSRIIIDLQQSLKNLDPRDYDSILSQTSQAWHQFTDTFRKSFILTLYGYFEGYLREECDEQVVQRAPKNYPATVENPSSYPHTIKMLWSLSEAGLIAPINQDTCKTIVYYAEIRHCIAHTDGVLDWYGGDEKIREAIQKFDGLTLIKGQDYEELQISNTYCKRMLDDIKKWSKEVFYAIHSD